MINAVGIIVIASILLAVIAIGVYCTVKAYRKQHCWLDSLVDNYDWIQKSCNVSEIIDSLERNYALPNIYLPSIVDPIPQIFDAYDHVLIFGGGATRRHTDQVRMYLCLRRSGLSGQDGIGNSQFETIAYSRSGFAVCDMPSSVYSEILGYGNRRHCAISVNRASRVQVEDMLNLYRNQIEQHFQSEMIDYVVLSPEWISVGYLATGFNYNEIIEEIHCKIIKQ